MYKKILCATLASLSLAGCASINPELKQQLKQGLAESLSVALAEIGYPITGSSQVTSQNNGALVDFTDFAECHILYSKDCSNDARDYKVWDTDKFLLQQMTPLQRTHVASIIEKDNMSRIDNEEHYELGEDYKLTIRLKNATAFGVPIESIETGAEYEWGYRKVTFANADDLAKVSRHFSISDPRFDQINSVLAVEYRKRFCDVSGENCDYKKIPARSLYDYKGRKLPDLDSVADGCYWGVVFNVHERSVSNQGGC